MRLLIFCAFLISPWAMSMNALSVCADFIRKAIQARQYNAWLEEQRERVETAKFKAQEVRGKYFDRLTQRNDYMEKASGALKKLHAGSTFEDLSIDEMFAVRNYTYAEQRLLAVEADWTNAYSNVAKERRVLFDEALNRDDLDPSALDRILELNIRNQREIVRHEEEKLDLAEQIFYLSLQLNAMDETMASVRKSSNGE